MGSQSYNQGLYSMKKFSPYFEERDGRVYHYHGAAGIPCRYVQRYGEFVWECPLCYAELHILGSDSQGGREGKEYK